MQAEEFDLRTLLLDPRQSEIDEICENKQERGKRKRLPKLTFARLKDDGGCQHTRLAADISSHHHGCADLRDNGTKSSHERGKEGNRASRHRYQTIWPREAPSPSSCCCRRGSSASSAAAVNP